MATSATSRVENGLMLIYILQNGATKVAKALAEKRIRELKPPDCDDIAWTVDAFLKKNKKKILAQKTGSNNKWKYFPTNSITDIDTWDLPAIIFILIETCSLDKEIVPRLEHLVQMRHKLVHAASTSIEDNKYEYYLKILNAILDECLKQIGEEELAREIAEMNDNIKNRTIFSPKGREALTKRDKVREPYEKLDATINLLQKFEQKMAEENRKTNVPELNLKIVFTHCTGDKNGKLSQSMADIFYEVLYKAYDDFSETTDEFRQKLREDIFETCLIFLSKGYLIDKAERKCVLLHIRCISTLSLLLLFRDYIDGILDKNIRVLQSAVKRCDGYEDTCLEVIVYKEDFWQIMNQIEEDLEKYVSSIEKQEHPPNGENYN